MTSATSIKDCLKVLAKKENISMQNILVLYALERTIYRISISKYNTHFTLKGGVFLYAFFNKNFPRATRDIDFLAQNISNDNDRMKNTFKNIFSIKCEDALVFDLHSLKIQTITEFKKYHGVNLSILTYLDKTRIPVSIDIGFGDQIYPQRTPMNFPVLLDMDHPIIYAYSIYTVLAEKFEAIASLGYFNSRLKDFYDIYKIAHSSNLEGHLLQEAVYETFSHRNTKFSDIIAFDEIFLSNNQKAWDAFIRKSYLKQNGI